MSAHLRSVVRDVEGLSLVELGGVIDEDNNLADLIHQVQPGNVLIHLAAVERINSLGVRDWVTWIDQLERKGCTLFYLECSPAIITQVNLVGNFVGNGTIVSFYAPYFRSPCARDATRDCERTQLIHTDEIMEAHPLAVPICRCDRCDELMEFDEIESSYLSFIKGIDRFEIPSDIRDAISAVGPSATSHRSMPLADVDASPVDSDGQARLSEGGWTPTVPGDDELAGLLSDYDAAPGSRSSDSPVALRTLLYVIAGLLVVAISLLTYVAVR